ncbi:hypothetical protein OG196_00995 [Kitasatospora purpeofusca]|uniref:hypothetical protein n=1 Tax=Kitasatospora purpeofusca TaxID=67352 RepID=UPI002E0F2B4D|nr:hypothetical protein OG715_00455 [Kitasatospora purpeofusca]WSR37787.1 hypothetical protein OG196_00995 [Kitasatospora purpeofusca]
MIDPARIDPEFGNEEYGENISRIPSRISEVAFTFTKDRSRSAHIKSGPLCDLLIILASMLGGQEEERVIRV